MKRKVGQEPERESKKRKEVGNDVTNHLCHTCFQFGLHVQQTGNDLKRGRQAYNAILEKGKLKGRFITHKFSTGWEVGVVKNVKKKKCVTDQFAVKYKSETY